MVIVHFMRKPATTNEMRNGQQLGSRNFQITTVSATYKPSTQKEQRWKKKRKKYIKDYKKLFNCDQAAQSDRSIYPCPWNNLRSAVFKRCKERKERKEGWEVKLWNMWKRCEKDVKNFSKTKETCERRMWNTLWKNCVTSHDRVTLESRSSLEVPDPTVTIARVQKGFIEDRGDQ